MYLSEAAKILGLSTENGVSFIQLKDAYRKAAVNTHPDKGGTKDDFVRVKAAYDLLKDIIANMASGIKQKTEEYNERPEWESIFEDSFVNDLAKAASKYGFNFEYETSRLKRV